MPAWIPKLRKNWDLAKPKLAKRPRKKPTCYTPRMILAVVGAYSLSNCKSLVWDELDRCKRQFKVKKVVFSALTRDVEEHTLSWCIARNVLYERVVMGWRMGFKGRSGRFYRGHSNPQANHIQIQTMSEKCDALLVFVVSSQGRTKWAIEAFQGRTIVKIMCAPGRVKWQEPQ